MDTNSSVVAIPRVASPVDSTVSQSVAAIHREPSIAETVRKSLSLINLAETLSHIYIYIYISFHRK